MLDGKPAWEDLSEQLNGALEQQLWEPWPILGRRSTAKPPSSSKCKYIGNEFACYITAQAYILNSYVQISAMTLGGMISADQRLRDYEAEMRAQRRWLREKAKWDRYEQEVAHNNEK